MAVRRQAGIAQITQITAKKNRSQARTSFGFISGKNQRIKTETSGSTQPTANHFQNDLPRLRAKNAVVSGTKKRMLPRNARIGMA